MAKTAPTTKSDSKLSQEDRLRSEVLLESIGDAVITTDGEGKISQINHVALKLLGYKESDLLGQWFPRAIAAVGDTGEEVDILDRPITRALLTGKPVSAKIYYRTKSGKPLPVFATASPLMVEGRPIGVIEVFHDITLEHNIDKMKSEFISLASHQLRTPLSAIKTYSHLIDDGFVGDLTPEQSELMGVIMLSIDRMNELIDTLLDTSKIEQGMLDLKLQPVNVTQLVEEIRRELQPQADAKDIKITSRLEPMLNIDSDPLLLKEVFSNLLSNAIKYTPPKGKVKISLRRKVGLMIYEVADTGYGIPRRGQSRIFSKFFRANNVIQKETWGTGLGLYIVKSIADNLGGNVWFTSRENVGSSFYFSLPIKKQAIIQA